MLRKACLANDTNLALGSNYEAKSYGHEGKSDRHKAKSYRHEGKRDRHEARSYRHETKSIGHEVKSLGKDIGIKKAEATSPGTSAFFTMGCAAMLGSREGGLSVCF